MFSGFTSEAWTLRDRAASVRQISFLASERGSTTVATCMNEFNSLPRNLVLLVYF